MLKIPLTSAAKKSVMNFKDTTDYESSGTSYSGTIGGESFSVSSKNSYVILPTAIFECPRCKNVERYTISSKFIRPEKERINKRRFKDKKEDREYKKEKLAELDRLDKEKRLAEKSKKVEDKKEE